MKQYGKFKRYSLLEFTEGLGDFLFKAGVSTKNGESVVQIKTLIVGTDPRVRALAISNQVSVVVTLSPVDNLVDDVLVTITPNNVDTKATGTLLMLVGKFLIMEFFGGTMKYREAKYSSIFSIKPYVRSLKKAVASDTAYSKLTLHTGKFEGMFFIHLYETEARKNLINKFIEKPLTSKLN